MAFFLQVAGRSLKIPTVGLRVPLNRTSLAVFSRTGLQSAVIADSYSHVLTDETVRYFDLELLSNVCCNGFFFF